MNTKDAPFTLVALELVQEVRTKPNIITKDCSYLRKLQGI